MKVLFDINTPAPLRTFLRRQQVVLAIDLGWQTVENGALLTAAEEAGFEVLVSCDPNLRYQQEFHGSKTRGRGFVLECLPDRSACSLQDRD